MLEWLRKRVAAGSGDGKARADAAASRPTSTPRPEHALLLDRGESAAAEAAARAALAGAPDDAEAALTLARLAVNRRKPAEAQRAIERVRALAPQRGEPDWLLGLLALHAGRLHDAEAAFERALNAVSPPADAHYQLAVLWRERGERERAVQACQAALRIEPGHAAARSDLGAMLRDAGRGAEALLHLEAAVEGDPKLAPAWFNLGTLRFELGRLEAAAEALARRLELPPPDAEAAYWLGHARMAQGDAVGARAAYARSLEIDPQFLRARWSLVMAQLEPVPADAAAEAASRAAFGAMLDKLASWLRSRAPADACEAVAVTQPYYLAYLDAGGAHEATRDLLGRCGQISAQAMAPWARKAGLAAVDAAPAKPLSPRSESTALRIGIASAHLHDHSVWNAIVRGWLEQFDRRGIELHLFALGGRDDAQTAFARRHAKVFHGPLTDWKAAAKAVAGSRLHALIYPEVGMDSLTGKLAALRLAPLQLAAWGHPMTTGLPTIDHFVSAAALEPTDAQRHYTERLHRLPRLGCTPRRFGTRAEPPDLARCGVPAGARVLLCAGMPFKYQPRHDALWAQVARRCAPCRLVFFRGGSPLLAERLEQRLRAAFAAAGLPFEQHALMLPWQSQAAFFGWLRAADVFLDNPGFSGFNTVMQAVECETPIVALEGDALRERFAQGVLDELGLAEWVAADVDGYVERTARLCEDRAVRAGVVQRLRDGSAALFDDRAASQAMQTLLETLVAAGAASSAVAARR